MIPVQMSWTPHPYRGAFAIVDDTDGATLESVRLVYDFLAAAGLRTTKTVWAFAPDSRCGRPPLPDSALRGVTLDEAAYRDYCAGLARQGFELALHGASAGNNSRARTVAAFDRLERELGVRSPVYLSHAKNVENLYWQQRAIAGGPLRSLMNVLAAGHQCSGEDPGSRYFWGDVCRERVQFLRLFRTPRINTLGVNPSMPYFETAKPYVRGWFTITDRRLEECTSPEALAMLSHENGLCLTRQHLSRFAEPGPRGVTVEFEQAMRRLRGAPDVWSATAGAVLERLSLLQGVVLAYRDSNLWIVNLNDAPVDGLQLVMGERPRPQPQSRSVGLAYHDGVTVIDRLPPRSIVYLDCSAPLFIADRNAVELDAALHGEWRFGHGTCRLNFGHSPWHVAGRTVAAAAFELEFTGGAGDVHAMSRASDAELTRLFFGHAALVVRRIAREGESLDLHRGAKRSRFELAESRP